MSEMLEVYRFKLNAGVTQVDLETANQTVQQFIQQQPGFLYRSLSFNKTTEEWLTILYWESEETAKQASTHFISSELTQTYMALIDGNTLTKEQSTVVFCQSGNGCGGA